ncbi:uncharacterized protein RCO7_09353 [Rhynchosporium graminicola]|uniref:Uncharacterized protein n=1 Tax=Rhynchosporium graminicola TaxID=2792576 RepID=A0A1E1KWW9_9HELO|nr:uncharacterized protein RCO7_09353 [Rhynchosporium commune]
MVISKEAWEIRYGVRVLIYVRHATPPISIHSQGSSGIQDEKRGVLVLQKGKLLDMLHECTYSWDLLPPS